MLKNFFSGLGEDIKEIGTTFAEGDIKTRLSFLIFGLGPLLRGQIVKGLAYLAVQIALIWYVIAFGWKYMSKFSTLGTVVTHKENRITVYGDNSFLFLTAISIRRCSHFRLPAFSSLRFCRFSS